MNQLLKGVFYVREYFKVARRDALCQLAQNFLYHVSFSNLQLADGILRIASFVRCHIPILQVINLQFSLFIHTWKFIYNRQNIFTYYGMLNTSIITSNTLQFGRK